ncbi:MAG TPA: response regulator [Candidatus Saccharimonadales bacterium]
MTKILLVEDDKSLREIYGVRLLAEGYDIISAGDGEAALAMAIKDRPSLIVSDVMMPKISGFDMLDILRSTTETKDIKVIMMTALSSDDQRKRGEQLGADKYLVKSQVGIEDVVRAVHEVLGDSPLAGATATAFPPTASSPAPNTIPAPAAPAPSMPTPTPIATPAPTAPTPQPVAPTASTIPSPSSNTANGSALPQPTAPFSTPRPGGLASRVIQPIERNEPTPAVIADQIEKELGSAIEAPAMPTTPPAPVAGPQTPEPTPSVTPAPAKPVISAPQPPAASDTPAPAPFQAPVPPTPPVSTIPPISYEETTPGSSQQTT